MDDFIDRAYLAWSALTVLLAIFIFLALTNRMGISDYLRARQARMIVARTGPVAALGDTREHVRAEAARQLGERHDRSAAEALVSVLVREQNVRVRGEIVLALGKTGGTAAVKPLASLLTSEQNAEVRSSIVSALANIGGTAAVETLASLLTSEQNVQVRSSIVSALGKMGGAVAAKTLGTLLGDPQVGDQAVDTLAALGESAMGPLEQGLKDGSPRVRSRCASALGRTGERRAQPALIEALGDPDLGVRVNAIEALSAIGVPLREMGPNGHQLATENCERIIRDGQKGSEPVLIEALEESGDALMADAFLNCGNERLAEAAADWAGRRGYRIDTVPGQPSVSWHSR